MEERWEFRTEDRVAVTVLDGDEAPAVDALVVLTDAEGDAIWQARTDNGGEAELFPSLFAPGAGPYGLEASAAGAVSALDDVLPAGDERYVMTPDAQAPPELLDLMFVIDTTGSMDDELSDPQAELQDAIERVQDAAGEDLAVRLSVSFCGSG